MADSAKGLMPNTLQNGFVGLMAPLVRLLARWKVNPNVITVLGVMITTIGAIAFMTGKLHLGGLFVLLGGVCDVIDGGLARSAGRVTRFGALFDSAVDRYAELVMFFGIVTHFVLVEAYITSVAIFVALCGSLMVSYIRARAEGLGFECKLGLMQRQERIVLIGGGALFHPVLLQLAIWVVAVFANYTALQRIRHVYKQEKEEKDKEKKI